MTASRVASKLYQGSEPTSVAELLQAEIHTVVYCAAEIQPAEHRLPGIHVLRCPFLDNYEPLDSATLRMIEETAIRVAARVRLRHRTLVTCAQGRNRSGLVTARALTLLYGISGTEAVAWVRRARPAALTNPQFVRILDALPAPLRGDRPRATASAQRQNSQVPA